MANKIKGDEYEILVNNYLNMHGHESYLWKNIPGGILIESGKVKN